MERTASLFRMSKLALNKSQLITPLSNDESENNKSDRRSSKIRLSEKGERPVPGFAFAGMMESFKTPGVIFEKGADLDSTSKGRERSRTDSSVIKNENSNNSKEKPKVYVKTVGILKMVEKVISLKKKRDIFIYTWRKI